MSKLSLRGPSTRSLWNKPRRNAKRFAAVLESLERRINLAIYIWTGVMSNSWSVGGNWQGGVSPKNDVTAQLVFPGGVTNLTSTNDITGQTFQSIEITASGYNIGGKALTLTGASGGVAIFGNFAAGSTTINLNGLTLTTSEIVQSQSLDATGLSITTPIAIGSNQLRIVGTGNTTLSNAAVISGTGGSVLVSSSGTVNLNAADTYTGATTIIQGTVIAGNSSALGTASTVTLGSSGTTAALEASGTVTISQTVNVASGSTVTLGGTNTSGTTTFSGAIALNNSVTLVAGSGGTSVFSGPISDASGSNSLTISATGGTVELSSSSSTYKGSTTVRAGTLLVGADAPSGGSSGSLGATSSAVVVGGGSASAALETAGANTVGLPISVQAPSSGNITLGGTGTSGTALFSGAITLGAPVTLTAASGGTASFSGAIGGANSVTVSGAGTVALSGSSSYSGGTSLLSGTLLVAANAPSGGLGALGTSTAAVLVGNTTGSSNATLETLGPVSIGLPITVQSGNTGTMTLGGSTSDSSTFTGAITLNRVTTLTAASGGTATFTGTVSGAVALNVAGPGTVALSNTGTGLLSDSVLGLTDTGTLVVSNPGGGTSNLSINTLELNGASLSIGTGAVVTLGGNVTADASSTTSTISGSGSLALGSADRTFTATATVANGPDLWISAPISGTVNLQKNGTGTLELSGASTYTGRTLADAGELEVVGNVAADGLTPGPLGEATGSVSVGQGGSSSASLIVAGSYMFARPLSVPLNDSQPVTIGGATTGTSAQFTGAIAFGSPLTLTSPAGGTTTFSGAISDTVKLTLNVAAPGGAVALTGSNSYRNGTTVSAGTLLVGGNSALGTTTSTVTVGGGTSSAALETSGPYTIASPVSVAAISGGGTATLGGTTGDSSAFSGAIALSNPVTFTSASGGSVTYSNSLSGTTALTVSGAGTTTLSGTSLSFTGPTTLSAGTLLVNGSIANSAVTESGGTLGGTGTIGSLTANGGTVSPGSPASSVGLLQGSAANFAGGGTLSLQVSALSSAGVDFDELNLGSGALTLGGSSTLTLDLSGLDAVGTAHGLVRYGTGALTGAFGTVNVINNPYQLITTLVYGASSLDVAVTENTTTALSASPSSPVRGQAVVLTATVTGSAPGLTPTGTVTFLEGSTILGTGTLSGGVASLSVPTLAVGFHSLTAVYGGDTNNLTSTSSALGESVSADSTTTSLSSTPSAPVFGQAVILTASVLVSSPGAGIPTGLVTFYDGGSAIGTGVLSPTGSVATAALTTSSLSVGNHQISARYGGDSSDLVSLSSTSTVTVAPDSTATALDVDVNPSVYGQATTFTASVSALSPGAGTPTGTVTFYDGSTPLGTATLDSSASATLSTAALAVGTHSITFVYGGDGNDLTSMSSAVSQVVGQDTTAIALNSSANPSVYGQSVTFTATVSVASPGAGTPTGTVTFYDGVAALGTGQLSTAGGVTTATLTTTALAVKTHSISAVYAGDGNDLGSMSATVSQVVGQDTTTLALSSSANPSDYGQGMTYTATVLVSSPGAGTPTGTVTFYNGTDVLGTGALSSAGGFTTATFSTSALAVGTYSITAAYGGDVNDLGSSSSAISEQVVQDSTTIALGTSANPSVYGQGVTITATVSVDDPGKGNPTGNVTFFSGGTPVATAALSTTGNLTTATFTTSALAVGMYAITAEYDGDGNDTGSVSSVLNQVVAQDSTTTTVSSSNDSSIYSETVTFTATVGVNDPGVGTPTGTVTFFDGSTALGTDVLSLVGGVPTATFSTGSLAVGTESITAVYSGDANDRGSTSSPLSQVVNPFSTTTVLNTSPDPSVVGQTVTLTATVSVLSPGVNPPTGTVTFSADGHAFATGTLSTTGGVTSATVTAAAPSAGEFAITASYSGDAYDASSVSAAVTQVVNQDSTITSLAIGSGSSVYGQTVNLTSTVSVLSPGANTPTGTVTFYQGSNVLGTAVLSTVGSVTSATLATGALPFGTDAVTAEYGGDTNNLGSISSAVSHSVTKDSTLTVITSTANPSVYGQSAAITATVSVKSPGANTPTGLVVFLENGAVIGTVLLDANGAATLPISTFTVATHSISAVYAGDGLDSVSSSSVLKQVVNKDTTATALASSVDPSAYGQSVTFTANVSASAPGVNTPTGTVTFMDGTTSLGTGALDVNGMATLTLPTLSVAAHSITVVYGGDTNDVASTSNPFSQVVNQASTTTTLTPSQGSSTYGQSITFTATVSVNSPGVSTPTGSVTFYDSGTSLGIGTLGAGGVATLTTSMLAVGGHSVTAVFSGDTNDATSTSLTLAQTVQNTTSTTMTSSVTPSVYGEPVVFTAVVTGAAVPGAVTPSGIAIFYDGSTELGTGTLDNTGTATLTVSSLGVGDHSITAVYGGDNDDLASASDNADQVVSQDQTATTLTVSPDSKTLVTRQADGSLTVVKWGGTPPTYGQMVTLTATIVAQSPGVNTPGGTATFYDGSAVLGTVTVDGSGTATLTTSTLIVGLHPLTVVYSGDTNDVSSTSNEVDELVQAATTTTLASSVNPSVYGQTVQFTATVSAGSVPGAGTPSGFVIFLNGNGPLARVRLNQGVATATASSLAVGTTSIQALYQGDSFDAASTASPLSQVVGLDSTTTTLAATPDPSVVGQAVTLTATVSVSAPGVNMPGGYVTFYDGGAILGTGSLDNSGVATLATSTLTAGDHPITAVYSGDNHNASSTSPELDEVVQNATSTLVAASLNPSVFGQSVTFTATVSVNDPGVGTPTGTVTFYDGMTPLGTGVLSTMGGVTTATITTDALTVGNHAITAAYDGDATDVGSTSSAVIQVIGQDNTSTALSSSNNPSVYTQSVTFTATVSVSAPGAGTPTGTVTFLDGSNVIGTGVLSTAAGVTTASFATSTLDIGTASITAVYSGDANDVDSTSSAVSQVVDPFSTTIVVSTSPDPSVVGQTVTATATVSVLSPGVNPPTGTVTFYGDGHPIGTGTLSTTNGVTTATVTGVAQSIGNFAITASYSGDALDAPSDSAAVIQAVNPDSTQTVLVAAADPAVYGQSVALTATVSVLDPGAGTPTGTVTFLDGSTALGTVALDANGMATLTTSILDVGDHPITAVYSGDSNDVTSTSVEVDQVVQNTTHTSLVASVNPSVYGQPVVFTATVSVALVPGAVLPSGTVTFHDGTTALGVGTLDQTGTATLSVSSLSVDDHGITATYAGDSYDVGSTSGGVSETVDQNDTTTTMSSSDALSVYGEPVTLTATVAVQSPGGGTPTGTIIFLDGFNVVGTSMLDDHGVATLVTSALNVGDHSIMALYSGDTNDQASGSDPLDQEVDLDQTATTLAISPDPGATAISQGGGVFEYTVTGTAPTYGQQVVLTATVVAQSPGVNSPTGTVMFVDDTTNQLLGRVKLDALSGTATLKTTTLAVGGHQIVALYRGDSRDRTSNSSLAVEVVQATTNTAITSASNPSVYGQPVTLTATVTQSDPGPNPGGTVQFFDGSTLLGEGTLDGSGTASITTSAISVGTSAITAVYVPDVFHVSSTSPALSQVVGQDSTTTTLTSDPAPSVYGQAVTLAATVAVTAPGSNTPTGTVTFYDGSINLGTGVLDTNGVATLSITSLPTGSDSISASYAGDTNDAASVSSPVSQEVDQTGTTTSLASSLNPSQLGTDAVTFTATVTANTAGVDLPTGTVTFYEDGMAIGSGAVSTTGGVVSATFTTSLLSLGSHTITAAYSGDVNDLPSTSDGITQSVISLNQPPTATAQTVTVGSNGVATVTLQGTDSDTPSDQLTFTITSLPASGTLITAAGVPVALNETFTSANATLTYLLPTEVLDYFSDTFTYTATDSGYPSGSQYNPLTSALATVTVQTPTGTTGVLRISGGLGSDSIALSETSDGTGLHVLVGGSAAGSDIALSSLTQIQLFGNGGNDSYTIAAGLPVPVSVLGGSGDDALTTGPNNLSFTGGVGDDAATVTLDSSTGTATLSPGAGTITDGGDVITLASVAGITVSGNSNDVATLSDSSGNNTFAATPTSATFSGTGFSETVSGFASVSAIAASGTTDTATLTSSSGNDTFTAIPGAATMTGTGYSNSANGFVTVIGNAVGGGTDSAHLKDAPGSNTFTATPTTATFRGTGFVEIANGFAIVYGTTVAGTTDTATLSDSSGANRFTAAPTYGLFSGNGFYNKATGFVSVLATAASGTTDTAVLSDSAGDNVFTATPTSATFSGTGFSNTANGFASVTATAASGTSDTATLTSSSGNDTFTASPAVAGMTGSGYSNIAKGFATMIGIAVGGSGGSAHLSDASGSNTLTLGSTTATFSGKSFSETASGFGTVFATAASGTTDTATLCDSSGSNKFTATQTYGLFSGSGFYDKAAGFASVTAIAASGTTDTATLSDTSGHNTFTATPTWATFGGTGFSNTAKGFISVTATAASSTTDSASLYDSSGTDSFTATPTWAVLKGTGYYNLASGFASVTGYSTAGGSDIAHLQDTGGSNTLSAAPTMVVFSGNGFSEAASGFSAVYASASSGTTDRATFSDTSGTNTFTATPAYAALSGQGYYNRVTGFVSVIANAASGTTDVATLSDSSGSNTFSATPTSATFSGSGFSNTANGFSQVIANATSGTTDTASLYDSSGTDTFTATPTTAVFKGTGFSNRANGFTRVTAYSTAGGSDSAHLQDTSGSNTFAATPTLATFSGSGFSESASGFSAVFASASSGTTDAATFSDTSGTNSFTATPTYALFTGQSYYDRVTGFVSVTANAASGTTDSATLSDSSGSNTFTASPTTATFAGTGFWETANGYGTVTASAASTSDVANLSTSSTGGQFTGSGVLGTLAGSNYTINVSPFKTINLTGSAGAVNKAHLDAIDFVLNEIGSWLSD
jgi:autotransporter-associated beta strand protein